MGDGGIAAIVLGVVLFSALLVFWSRRRLDHRRARRFRFTFYVSVERSKEDRDETSANGHAPAVEHPPFDQLERGET